MPKKSHSNHPGVEPDYATQLQVYQRKITNILESFTDAFFEVDQNWIVTYWNREAERLLVMPRKDVLGKNLWNVYQEATKLKFFEEYHRAMKENVSVRFEEYFEPKDIWIEVAAFPSGSGLSVYFKDITSRKLASNLLELEKQRYQDLFDLSPIPQWVYDLETLAFLQVNEAAITHYGYSREEFLNMTIKDIRPAEELAALTEIISTTVKPGEYSQSTVKHRKKNGQVIYVLVEGNTVSYACRNARLALAVDITDRICDMQAIEARNKQLLEISWLQSHKVRAPLARILGLTELMDNQDLSNISEVRELVDLIRSSATDLDKVVREITKKCTPADQS